MARKRPGIRRSKVRTPQLALAELCELMPLPPRRQSIKSWFFSLIRSLAAKHMKAGL